MQTSDKSYSEGIKSLTYVPSISGKASGRGPRGPARNPLEPDPEEEGTWGWDDTGTQGATASPRGSGPPEEGPCRNASILGHSPAQNHWPRCWSSPRTQTWPGSERLQGLSLSAPVLPPFRKTRMLPSRNSLLPWSLLARHILHWHQMLDSTSGHTARGSDLPSEAAAGQLNDPEPHRDLYLCTRVTSSLCSFSFTAFSSEIIQRFKLESW